MSIQFDKEQAFNFFSEKNITINKDTDKFTKFCAMFLYTVQKVFTPKVMVIFFLGIISSILAYNYMMYSDVSKKQVQAELITKEQQLLKEKREFALAEETKTAKEIQQDAIMDEGRYNVIKNIPEEVIVETLTYIDSVQAQELKKLNTLYWSMVYINENETSLNMEVVNSEIQKNIFSIKSHYASRKKDVVENYALIKLGEYKSVPRTYDNMSGAKVLLTWINYRSSKSEIYQPDTEVKYAEWMKYLKKPQNLAAYLEKNKNMIETTGFIK